MLNVGDLLCGHLALRKACRLADLDRNLSGTQALEQLIKPAVYGVENVLLSALAIETMEKVVLTSSLSAVFGKLNAAGDHMYSEADWCEIASDTYLPYNRYYFEEKVL